MLLFVAMPLPIDVHDACCLKVINNLKPVFCSSLTMKQDRKHDRVARTQRLPRVTCSSSHLLGVTQSHHPQRPMSQTLALFVPLFKWGVSMSTCVWVSQEARVRHRAPNLKLL